MFHYVKTLRQLHNAENTYGREIGNLNNTINNEAIRTNELRNRIEYLEDVEEESLQIIDDLHIKLDELKNLKKFLRDDNKKLRIKNLIKENDEMQDKVKKDEAKIRDMLNRFNNNIRKNRSNLYKGVKYKKNELSTKLDKLDNDVKKLNNYINENNNKIINTENKFDNANNKYNNLLLEYNQLNEKLTKIKDKLYEIKNGSNKSEDDTDEKGKKIVELKKI